MDYYMDEQGDNNFVNLKKFVLSRKKHILLFVGAILVILGFIILINYCVNPFHVFKTNFNFADTYDFNYDRQCIYPIIKLNKQTHYDYVVCGSSTIISNVDDKEFEKIYPNKTIYRLAISGATPDEKYDLIKSFITANPEVKRVFVSVDFIEMLNEFENALPKYTDGGLNREELYFLLMSCPSTKYSLKSIGKTFEETIFPQFMFGLKKKVLFKDIPSIYNYRKKIINGHNRYPKMRYTDWVGKKLKKHQFARIKDIKELCEQKNIYVVFYSSPLHAYTLYDVCYQGVYGELEDFKREFAKVTPFYDFSYISDEFSKDPVSDENPYWVDAAHSDIQLGNEMLKKMMDGKSSFGRYVTLENVEKYIKIDRKNLSDFSKENEQALKKYVTYGHMNYSCEEDIIYLYE